MNSLLSIVSLDAKRALLTVASLLLVLFPLVVLSMHSVVVFVVDSSVGGVLLVGIAPSFLAVSLALS